METCLVVLIFFINKKIKIMKTYFNYVLLCTQNKMEKSTTSIFASNVTSHACRYNSITCTKIHKFWMLGHSLISKFN